MSSFVNAAPFNEQNNDIITNNSYNSKSLNQGSTNKRRTIKKKDNNTSISQKIKDIWDSVEDDSDEEGDNYTPPSKPQFTPPPAPQLAELNRKPLEQENSQESQRPQTNHLETPTPTSTPENSDAPVNVEGFNNIDNVSEIANEQYYKQYVPYYNNTNNESMNRDELMEKMNKVIQLLEDQQDEKSNNVTEELVLYCFLGVFVIFVVDSFARAGKYTR